MRHAGFFAAAQHGADSGVCVLYERAGVAVEVDALARVECHVLARVNLQQEVLERSLADGFGHAVDFFLRHAVELAERHGHFARRRCHISHKVVGVHHRAFAAFHLAFGQFHHAVAEVHKVLAPAETEAVEQHRQHLEVVVLLVAHHVYHAVDVVVVETLFGGADVLRHVYRGAVGAEQQLLVEAVGAQVGPYRAVLAAVEHAFFESFEHFLLAVEVCLRLVVYLVESHSHALVSLVETGIYPAVHLFPEGAYFGVAFFPLAEHGAGVGHDGRGGFGFFLAHAFGLQLGEFFLIVLVERYVAVAYEVVALGAGTLGSGAVEPALPCEHRLADVYASVVHYVGLYHAVAAGTEYVGEARAEEYVAQVAEVQRLVGVR